MIKKKTCKRTTKRTTKCGKWSEEYKVKLSVKPLKRKKKGSWESKLGGSGAYRREKRCPVCGEKFTTMSNRTWCSTRCQNKGLKRKSK